MGEHKLKRQGEFSHSSRVGASVRSTAMEEFMVVAFPTLERRTGQSPKIRLHGEH